MEGFENVLQRRRQARAALREQGQVVERRREHATAFRSVFRGDGAVSELSKAQPSARFDDLVARSRERVWNGVLHAENDDDIVRFERASD